MRARGFTLLEVLLAAVLLALGILGGVALQMAALRTRHQSALLSQATQLAAGLAEQMRANPAQIPTYLTLNYDALAEPVPSPPASLCHGPPCAAEGWALAEMYDAKLQVLRQLPAGRVLVCRDAGLWSGGKLRWACSGGVGAPLVVKVGWRGKNPDGTPQLDVAGEYLPGVALAVGAMP